MDFSKIAVNTPQREIPVPKDIIPYLMTPMHRDMMTEETGADCEWMPEEAKVFLRGSAEQIKKATRLLNRVLMHCHWGRSEDKITRLMRPEVIESTVCRLSPMNSLRPYEKILNTASPIL